MEIMTRFRPEGWTLRSLGQVFVERKEKGSDRDFPALSVTMNGIVPQLETAAKTDRGDDRKVVRAGDYVINSRSDRKGSGGISDLEGSVSLISIVMKPTDIEPSFAHHLLRSVAFQEEFYRFGRGIVADLWSTRFDDLKRIQVYLPPRDRQRHIATDLDRETARIDALIEKKTRFIELLKEKRQALITQAVTKGLDPTVPMKDSGVEWIGEVPAHWEQTKLRYIVRERSGKTPSKDNGRFWDGDVPWVTPKDMKIDVIETSLDKITEHAVKQCGMTLFEPGTILVVVRGMILAHSFPVAEISGPVTVNQDMKALTPCANVEPTFLRLLLQSLKQTVVDILVAEAAHGTRVLRTDIWKQLPLFLPTIEEQKAITQRVEFDSERVDSLVDATNRSIDLLKERRSALITAAVTGQIDLREDAA